MNTDGWEPISSDHLDAVKYDSFEKQLTIRFTNGSYYAVHGVLPRDYQAFMNAPSQGHHYHDVLKQNHEIERVK